MSLDRQDVTESYRARARLLFGACQPGPELGVAGFIRTPDGRILLAHQPIEANLFAAVICVDRGEFPIVGEFRSYAASEAFLDAAESAGWRVIRWVDAMAPMVAAVDRALKKRRQ